VALSNMSKKKHKVRVDFRKNRAKRVRRQNLTRELLSDEENAADQATGERISGKGNVSRRRTVVTESGDDETLVRDVDLTMCRTGRVLSFIGHECIVADDSGREFLCTIRRVVRTMAREGRNAVVTGDHVQFIPADDGTGVIERVEPRSGVLSRSSRNREHVIVANVDQVLIVVSADDPPLKPGLIDRYLISSEKGNVRSIICINKIDLVSPVDLQPLVGMYASIGYDVVLTSAETGVGAQRLRQLLQNRETVLSGQSGVGKSSLLNLIQPGLALATSAVSGETGKGRHTTRRAVLLPLEFGGWVADTPGVRQFGLWDVQPEEVEGFFVEFRPFVTLCHFPDCTHTHEHGCGVKTATEHGMIAQVRYDSYVRLLDEDAGRRKPIE
jgi:ribosome biogenesis GTPase